MALQWSTFEVSVSLNGAAQGTSTQLKGVDVSVSAFFCTVCARSVYRWRLFVWQKGHIKVVSFSSVLLGHFGLGFVCV